MLKTELLEIKFFGHSKLLTDAKLSCLKWKFLYVKLNFLNRTDFLIETTYAKLNCLKYNNFDVYL